MTGPTPKLKRVAWEAGRLLGMGGLLVFLMLWLSGAFISKIQPGPPITQPKPPVPKTARVEKRSFPMIIEQVGTVQPRTQAQVASRVMGQIRDILAQEGEAVAGPGDEKGVATILARLDDREIKARIQQGQAQVLAMERALAAAKARLAVAQAELQAAEANATQVLADFRRYEDLYRKQAATGQQMDHARARREEAEARVHAARQQTTAAQKDIERTQAQKEESQASVDQARVMLSYTTIEAPFGGVLVRKLVDVGDTVSPGQALFLLETPAEPELHALVAESLVPRLQKGTAIPVRIDALEQTFHGVIRDIVRQASPRTRTVTVKVSIPAHPDLFSGMSGHIKVTAGKYEALVIPWSAVHEVGQLHLVYAFTSAGYSRRRFVTLGERHEELVEVLSGLQAGEEVVLP
jgi:HlyD family secretion protein